jgi:hypothetical protein
VKTFGYARGSDIYIEIMSEVVDNGSDIYIEIMSEVVDNSVNCNAVDWVRRCIKSQLLAMHAILSTVIKR